MVKFQKWSKTKVVKNQNCFLKSCQKQKLVKNQKWSNTKRTQNPKWSKPKVVKNQKPKIVKTKSLKSGKITKSGKKSSQKSNVI